MERESTRSKYNYKYNYSVFCVRPLKYCFTVIHFSQVRTDDDVFESKQTFNTNISSMQFQLRKTNVDSLLAKTNCKFSCVRLLHSRLKKKSWKNPPIPGHFMKDII